MREKDFEGMYGPCVQITKSVYNTQIFQITIKEYRNREEYFIPLQFTY